MATKPLAKYPQTQRMYLTRLMKRLGMVFAKDLPRPKKKIRAPEDLLPDLEDND